MKIEFLKMQACGNDYIYIDARNFKLDNVSKVAKSLSVRRLSVGSDGLVLIENSNIGDFKMSIYNADGSKAKMCGNAIRCVGKFVFDNGFTDKKTIYIETLSGVKKVKVNLKGGKVISASVEIGKCKPISRLFAKNINILGKEYCVFLCSVGNPHAVLLTQESVDGIDLQAVAEFVNSKIHCGVNVEIINILGEKAIKMRVYERGSGETLACGTGASASVGVLTLCGKVESNQNVAVNLRGGKLNVKVEKNGNIILSGKVKTVYEGKTDLKV